MIRRRSAARQRDGRTPGPHGPAGDDRGAALVEASIVMLLILTIAAAILEYGNLFGSTIDVASAARSATRAGTSSTTKAPSDFDIVQTVVQRPGGQRDGIEKIVVYKANAGQSAPPKPCLEQYPAPPGLRCNVFLPEHFDLSEAELAATPGAQSWPPSARVPGDDYLGVWVKVDRPRLISLVWSPSQYTDYFVMRIDPSVPTGPTAAGSSDFTTNTNTRPPYRTHYKCWDGKCPPANNPSTGGPPPETVGGTGGSA